MLTRPLLFIAAYALAASALLASPCSGGSVVAAPAPAPAPASTSTLSDELARIPPLTAECSPETALAWISSVGDVMGRVATGGLPELLPAATDAVKTLATQIVAKPALLADKRVLRQVIDTLPSLWAAGFWYSTPETWTPLLTSVFLPVATQCKTGGATYELEYVAVVNATAVMVRFTKDNVFSTGVDTGAALVSPYSGFLEALATLVASVSPAPVFTLSGAQLRAFMQTLHSKNDGMDTSVAFPVFVDTKKFARDDLAALHALLQGNTLATTQSL